VEINTGISAVLGLYLKNPNQIQNHLIMAVEMIKRKQKNEIMMKTKISYKKSSRKRKLEKRKEQ
jgi:hypothetical protein